MPVLENARWERFVHNRIKGMALGPSYEAAGYDARGNAAVVCARKLVNKAAVKARYKELMAPGVKETTDVRDAARQYTVAAVKTLATVMNDIKAPQSARVAAANCLLDRGHGKAVQHIEAEINLYDALGLDDKRALLEALDMLDGDEEGDKGGPAPTHR